MAQKLKVTLIKSMIGRPEKHRKILKAMKLTKLHRTVEFSDSPSIRGMVNKVSHLLSVEEFSDET